MNMNEPKMKVIFYDPHLIVRTSGELDSTEEPSLLKGVNLTDSEPSDDPVIDSTSNTGSEPTSIPEELVSPSEDITTG